MLIYFGNVGKNCPTKYGKKKIGISVELHYSIYRNSASWKNNCNFNFDHDSLEYKLFFFTCKHVKHTDNEKHGI